MRRQAWRFKGAGRKAGKPDAGPATGYGLQATGHWRLARQAIKRGIGVTLRVSLYCWAGQNARPRLTAPQARLASGQTPIANHFCFSFHSRTLTSRAVPDIGRPMK